MPDLPPEPQRPSDADFDDHLDALDASLHPDGGRYAEAQLAREEVDRAAIDILEGLRKLQSTEPVRWTIERVDGEGTPGLLAKWPTVSLTWERIRDEFGPGTYRVEGRTNRGGYVRRTTITIASDAPRKVREGMHANAFNVTEFLTQQEQRDRTRREEDDRRYREREEKEERQRTERKELLLALGPALLTAAAQLFNRPQIDVGALAAALKPAPAPDPLVMIAALKQLAPEQREQPGTLETALKIVDVVTEKGGLSGSNGQTGIMDILKELVHVAGPTVGPLIQSSIERAQANAQAQAVAQNGSVRVVTGAAGVLPSPAGATAQATPAPEPSGDPAVLDLLPHVPWLQEQLARCASAAAKDRDPQLYAAVFLEELPEGLKPERILELLSAPDWFQKLCGFDARIANQGAWWDAMRRQLLEYLREAIGPRPPVSTEVQRPMSLPSLTGGSS